MSCLRMVHCFSDWRKEAYWYQLQLYTASSIFWDELFNFDLVVQMELQDLLQRAQAAARTARQLAKPLMK